MYKYKELFELEPNFKPTNFEKFTSLPDEATITETIKSLEAKNHKVILVEDEAAALEEIKKIIPDGSRTMDAGSVTLDQIGFKSYYFGKDHKWDNLHQKILDESDAAKQGALRKSSLAADYFVSSVGAISTQGNLFASDASGTRVGGFFAASNVVVVAGINKIVANEQDGIERATGFCYECESVRARKAYGVPGSLVANFVQIRHGNVFGASNTTVILIKKQLGY